MLTIARKAGQAIRIADSIRVTIKEVRGKQVRLQIEAPRDLPIYREEIYAQIVQQNALAALANPALLENLE